MNLQQLLLMAMAGYFDFTTMVMIAICEHARSLHILPPGTPEQIMMEDGVRVDDRGIPIYGLIVRLSDIDTRSPMAFGRALQAALDATCYARNWTRIKLLRIDQLKNGYVRLTLTWGTW